LTAKDTKDSLNRLRRIIQSMKSALVAYSGGVDSTLVAAVAHAELADKVLAVTAQSEMYPEHQLQDAKRTAKRIGIRHKVIHTSELAIENFSENPPNRCYYCKHELFGEMREVAQREGLAEVMDGANADDPLDHRPGLRAAEELGVRSPLREAGIGKELVRAISRELGLPTWSKPAFACFASRFPYGLRITPERIEMVRRAEEHLRSLGLAQYRVRHHDTIARIEAPSEEIEKLSSPGVRAKLVAEFKRIGYAYVTLDLEGFRSGSMNEVLGKNPKEIGTANEPSHRGATAEGRQPRGLTQNQEQRKHLTTKAPRHQGKKERKGKPRVLGFNNSSKKTRRRD
jgi:uncharacterized protein